jgi:phenylalanyl-tRNA synthetase beta chain
VEKKKLAVVLASESKTEKEQYFKLKEIVEYISQHIVNISVDYSNSSNNKMLHPINSCAITCGDVVLGEMGIMHPAISKNIDKRKTFAVLELDVDKMIEQEKNKFNLVAQSKFQTVSVDYNFVADKNMPYSKLEKVLSNFRASYILEHSLKDIYINDEVLKDKISYTINFNITPKDKTLEASDIEKFSKRLISTVEEIGVVLRS